VATAFKIDDYAPVLPPAARTRVHVAFDASASGRAIATAAAATPIAVRNATLDELALRDLVNAAIAAAAVGLSPAMFDAFLDWGAGAVDCVTKRDDEDDLAADDRLIALGKVLRGIWGIKVETPEEAAFVAWLSFVETGETKQAGPVRPITDDDACRSDRAAAAGAAGLEAGSPLVSRLQALGRAADALAAHDRDDWPSAVGILIRDAFLHASRTRAVHTASRPGTDLPSSCASHAGLTPEFQRLLDRADDAHRLLAEYTRTVSEPAEATYWAARAAAEPMARTPHIQVAAGLNFEDEPITLRSDNPVSVTMAHTAVSMHGRKVDRSEDPENADNTETWLAAARKVLAVDKLRQREVRQATECVKRATGIDTVRAHDITLTTAVNEAVDAAIYHPPVTVAEFQAQCRLNDEHGACMDDELLLHAKALLAVALPTTTAWNVAYSAWATADAAERMALAAGDNDAGGERAEAYERLSSATLRHCSQAILIPSPHRAALAWKMEQLFGQDAREVGGSCANWDAELVDAVMADAGRLLTGADR